MICEKCKQEFFEDWRKDKEVRKKPCRFCSRACSASRDHSSIEYRKQISTALKNSERAKLATKQKKEKNPDFFQRYEKTCPVCKESFFVRKSAIHKIYCSKKCYNSPGATQFRKKSIGGYREGSGRSKHGYYKGIYCGSTWELAWAIYQLDHKIPFKRFPEELTAPFTKRKYIPDFLQNGNIVEIKGRREQSVLDEKNKIAEYNGYKVNLKLKEDLIEEFLYVSSTYNIPKGRFYELYDNYKPEYIHTCLWCQKEFSNNKKKSIVCSRRCAGLLSRQKVKYTSSNSSNK